LKEENNRENENWLRGKVERVPDLLQPAAHALLQSKEEVSKYLRDFPEDKLWIKPAGRASVAFHLQHIAGVIDRLLTYAKGDSLTETQLNYVRSEGVQKEEVDLKTLIANVEFQIDKALEFLKTLDENNLNKKVEIGRKRIPSTLIGVLFHAGEHSQRHIGQLLVTVSVVKNMD
jgi:uncharacterized damage-inducible protein DinB